MTATGLNGSSDDGPLRQPRRRRDIIIGSAVVVGAAMLLVAIAAVSRGATGGAAAEPSPTGVLWSAAYGDFSCEVDEHHIVMADAERVWALDLRDGAQSWSVDVDGDTVGHECLRDAAMVALSSYRDTGGAPRQDTRLLDAATGEERWRFPAEAAMRVLDLGVVVGLVNAQNTLTAVAPDDMTTPLWTHEMAPPSKEMTFSNVEPIDDDHVSVSFGLEDDGEDMEHRFVIRTADGTAPAWARGRTLQETTFQRIDGVALRWSRGGEEHVLTALDPECRELWEARNAQSRLIAGKLYLVDLSARGDSPSGIRLVDPLTGTTLAQVAEKCDWVTELPGGRIGLFSDAQWISLDADLVEENRQSMANRIFEFADEGHLFIGEFTSEDWERVLALEVPGGDVVWTNDLVPDQRIDRIGAHLVTTDEDNGIIQALEGPG